MRFAITHKTTSYLAVACAFLAMVGGGMVSPIVVAIGVVGLVGSWFIEPPRVRIERYAWMFTAASAVGLAYALTMAVTTGDYLGYGGGFLVILTVARAATRRSARDWQQLYLLAFLMLVAGSVLNGEVSYAVCFFGFVITGTWALILFHLRREMEDNFLLKHADPRASQRVEIRRILESRRIVDRRFLIGTGFTTVGFFVLAIAMFLAIPRVGTGIFYRGKGGPRMAGFSDGVKLGGHGRIKDDSTIIMRATVSSPALRGRRAPYLYWRGVVFDHYARGQWSRTRAAPVTQSAIERLPGNRERRLMFGPASVASAPDTDAALGRTVAQDIWLDPVGSDVMFAASTPIGFEVPAPPQGARGPLERNDEVRVRHDGPIHYRAWSVVDPPSAAAVGAARSADPREPIDDVYRQLPPEITAATRELAQQIVAGADTDYAKATRLRDWLQANLSYTLDLRDPGSREPIDYFLFDRRAGHCEYFASAFAVMGRAVGLRTRSVNGFLGGEWNEFDDYIAVRAGDAHSWTEIYFDGFGWLTFDATPSAEVDQLGRGASGWFAKMRRWLDTLRFQWNKWVIDYDLTQQVSMFRSIGQQLRRAGRALGAAGRAVEHAARQWWPALAALAIGLALWLGWRRRRAPIADLQRPPPRTRAQTELARVYERAARKLARRAPAITPRELARDLSARGVAGAAPLATLTEIYYAGQWGGRVDDDVLATARRLAGEIDAAVRSRTRA